MTLTFCMNISRKSGPKYTPVENFNSYGDTKVLGWCTNFERTFLELGSSDFAQIFSITCRGAQNRLCGILNSHHSQHVRSSVLFFLLTVKPEKDYNYLL